MSGDINGATECVMGSVPCLLPNELLFINKDSKHLKYRNSRVQLVEQYLILLIELIHLIHDVFLKPPHQVLESCSGIKVFLLEPLLLMLLLWDVWIVNACQVLCVLDLVDSLDEVFLALAFRILVVETGLGAPEA